jgi:predicted nucleic acid-binding protein
MRIGLDTNVLAYAEGLDDGARKAKADACLALMLDPRHEGVLPVQVLGELFRVLTRKARRPRSESAKALARWTEDFALAATTQSAFLSALGLATDHQLDIWDAVILAVCEEAGCRLLLSEDFQDGFAWGGITVVDPFAAEPHPLLAGMGGGR